MSEKGLAELISFVHGFGWELTGGQIDQFDRYLSHLLEWNSRMNLTAITDPQQIVSRHFCDSVSCIAATGSLDKRRLIDVGSGAGFPGIPLKIVFPDISLTLVESVRKKSDFLRSLVDYLALTDTQVLNLRAEAIGQRKEYRESYDIATARAVAHMAVLAEYLLPLIALGGSAIAMKGKGAAEEIQKADFAISTLGGELTQVHRVDLPRIIGDATGSPLADREHFLVVIKKVQPTPQKYPRRAGIPTKRPLGMT